MMITGSFDASGGCAHHLQAVHPGKADVQEHEGGTLLFQAARPSSPLATLVT